MNKVAVIDYDAGNTMSVVKALEYLGMNVVLTRDTKSLVSCDRVIFPGVGAYFDAMTKLKEYKLTDTVKELANGDHPFLGICLGMQLLFTASEEIEGCSDLSVSNINGLNILPGNILKFRSKDLKIPHMGWNSINITNSDSRLFKDLNNNEYMYFVHSFYLKAENSSDVAATCDYGTNFDCAIEHGNIFGCQFHPEKSGEAGLQILKNFCQI